MTAQLTGTSASLIESISFSRQPGICEFFGAHHDRWSIQWFDPHLDANRANHVYWCDHPLCGTGATRWRLRDSPPEVKLIAWIPTMPAVAVAYLLLVFPLEEFPHMEARIGIRDQWQDHDLGNLGNPNREPGRQFTERYFAESGPGVYPAPIIERQP